MSMAQNQRSSAENSVNDDRAEKGELYTHYSHPGGAALGHRSLTPGGHPVDTSQPAFPVYHRKFANPAPLGLAAFGFTTFLLSMINIGAAGVTIPSVVVSPALIYGGFIQLLAGVFEWAVGNTFGATAFCSFGGFWMSYALLISPWFGVTAAYADAPEMFGHAVGLYLFGWMIFVILMAVATLRSSIALSSVFWLVAIVFMLLGIHEFKPDHLALQTAGGAVGLAAAANAWYVCMANLLTPETSYFILPVGRLDGKRN